MAKILLVEDDNNLREIFELRLQADGYDTVTASDGEEALSVALKEKPELIIADVMMPKLSGFEMLETLRASPEMKTTKVVMMTALGQAEDRARGEKLGVVKYLVKSQVTLEDFVRVVREVLPASQSSAGQPAASVATKDEPPTIKKEGEQFMQDDNAQPNNQPAAGPDDNAAGSNPISGVPGGSDPAASSGQMSTEQEQEQVQKQVDNFASGAPDLPSTPGSDSGTSPFGGASSPATPAGDSSTSAGPGGDDSSGSPSSPAGDSGSSDSGQPSSPAPGPSGDNPA